VDSAVNLPGGEENRRTEYSLRDDTDGLHCYVSISIDEDEKIAELARREGVSVD
jgi:hypothetical protein